MKKIFEFLEDLLKNIHFKIKNSKDDFLLWEGSFTIVDLETTGFNLPPVERIIEIGAVRVENLTIVKEFSTLVNPHKPIPPIVSDITGIKNYDVKNAPNVGPALKDFYRFSQDSVMVAYNVAFDFEFIRHASILSMGYSPKERTLCAFELIKKILFFLDKYDLEVVCDYFDIKINNRHRALGDARATALLFLKILDILRKIGINSFNEAKFFELANTIPKQTKELLEHYRRLGVI
ncbi:MAG: 3'-5' exonuclease [Proteobacteria bacterium]|nr:3'-5' exonuclease [Pseudomonadota bacterium]